ncbi:beta-1,3-galactosyltransferase 6 [Sitophilus oryzae]|uniref:Hexosyltransferase n=1 Tax=Sitophilus oryzae TaxID=7048 RepID=A0A6J2YQ22_SITOR|nr:beta-1,3-galactosyltransferase 6 [Sitophilus oryzae]
MRRVKESKYCRIIFAALFSFLLGCMITLNLTPIDKTCIVDNTDREYNIMQNSKLKNPEVIVLILSAVKNSDRRNIIRETWLTLGNNVLGSGIKYRYKHYFVIGSLGLSNDEILHISTEQSQNSDILILPLYDNYKNLTEKVLKSFEWLNLQYDYGLGYKYVLKCDDDSVVNLQSLLVEIPKLESTLINSNLHYPLNLPPEKLNHFITTNIQSNEKINTVNIENMSIYWGYFHGNARIKRNGKWQESEWILCDNYVPYALGGGYILSRNLVSYIGKNVNYLRTFKSEDVSVGLWLSAINNIIRVHDIRFDTEWTSRGCKNYYLVTHHISPTETKFMFESLVNNKQLCVREVEKRKYYLYNWSALPSECCVMVN